MAVVCALVAIQCAVGTTYRAAQSSGRKFAFSTLSSIALAEGLKLLLAAVLHSATQGAPLWRGLQAATWRVTGVLVLLALGYAANNQMFFHAGRVAELSGY